MVRRALGSSIISVLGALVLTSSVLAAPGGVKTPVIVAFDEGVANPQALARQLGQRHGFSPRHVFGTVFNGFAASMPARAAAALALHPSVIAVEADRPQSIAEQSLPTGVNRIEVDKNTKVSTTGAGVSVNVAVAVIDTGIAAHPDLNVAGGYSAVVGSWSDVHGHGTHVAGTIGARDNSEGVVGVAPGAPLYAVRVCGDSGICWNSDIIKGIDWVAARKADFKARRTGGINFAAANFSITSADSSRSCSFPANLTHRAICKLVGQGVVFAMAAGNDARKKTAYPVAFTVASVADLDGRSGRLGGQGCGDDDDTLSNFSNWGVDIAAPGSCIFSTHKGGGYATMSGTSMATPHVAGAVALYLHATNRQPATSSSGVTAIENAIVSGALAQSHRCGYSNERGSTERLLFANATGLGGTGTCD